MPPWPVPLALSLPGLALRRVEQVLGGLDRRVGAHLIPFGIEVHQRERRVVRARELGQARVCIMPISTVRMPIV